MLLKLFQLLKSINKGYSFYRVVQVLHLGQKTVLRLILNNKDLPRKQKAGTETQLQKVKKLNTIWINQTYVYILKALSHEAIFFLQLATQIWVKKIFQAPVEF